MLTMNPSTNDSTPTTQTIQRECNQTIESIQQQLMQLKEQYLQFTQIIQPKQQTQIHEAHTNELSQLQSVLDATNLKHSANQGDWLEHGQPILQTELAQLEQRESELALETQRVVKECQRLTTIVNQLQSEESLLHERGRAVENGIGRLPLKCLQKILTFVTKQDLHHTICSTYAFQQLFDRGSLWMAFAVDLVHSIISAQKQVAQALESKRRMLGGLTQDFHSSNFLAACARAPLPGTNGAVQPTTELTPDARSQIFVSVPTTKDTPTSGKKGANGPVTLGKADLFARALQTLQKQVDPALSDFEDLSQRLSSHQNIIQFLERQHQEHKHKLGVARIAVGTAHHDLHQLSAEKDTLARRIHSIEEEIKVEKKKQADIQSVSEAALKKLKAQTNLRKNFEEIIAQNLGQTQDEEEPAPETDSANGDARTPQQEQAIMAENITLLKQQKKLLIKAVKSMQVDIDAVKQEKIEYKAKLEELKSKLAMFNL